MLGVRECVCMCVHILYKTTNIVKNRHFQFMWSKMLLIFLHMKPIFVNIAKNWIPKRNLNNRNDFYYASYSIHIKIKIFETVIQFPLTKLSLGLFMIDGTWKTQQESLPETKKIMPNKFLGISISCMRQSRTVLRGEWLFFKIIILKKEGMVKET